MKLAHPTISVIIFVLAICVFGVKGILEISDDDYKVLPNIFHIDPYEECLGQGKEFCKVTVVLKPLNTTAPSRVWRLIERSKRSKMYYNHDELYHAICARSFCKKNYKTITKKALSECYSSKYKKLGLRAEVVELNCNNGDESVKKIRAIDVVYLISLVSYIAVVLFATIFDYRRKRREKKALDKYIAPFSVIHNWKKLMEVNRSEEFQKLKCVQGIRTYTTVLVIFCHTFSSYAGGYVANTKYLEDIPSSPIRNGIRCLFMFLVQTFFLLSAWFLSHHFFQTLRSKKVTCWKFVSLTLLNRYLRLLPLLLVCLGVGSTVWLHRYFYYGPVKALFSDKEFKLCQKNWWTVPLFISNHCKETEMCYFITWYLSADMQLYVLSLLIFALIWKFQNRAKLIISAFLVVGIAIPAVYNFVYDFDIIYRITPENTKIGRHLSFLWTRIYSSTYANMATYMLGLFFGYYYSDLGNRKLMNKKWKSTLWWCSFVALPFSVVVVSCYEFQNKVVASMLSGILKPLFAFGVGVGILGMSQGKGGVVRRLCEWRPAVVLSNFTYSTYLVHYGIVFSRIICATQPLYLSDWILITSLAKDVTLAFFCGFLLHIFIEMPAAQLQNMLVPKSRSTSKVKVS